MSKTPATPFPLKDLWLPALPFLPLIAMTVLLSRLVLSTQRLEFLEVNNLEFIPESSRNFVHLGDMLVYYSVSSFHVLICFFVVFYFVFLMRNLPETQYRKSKIFLAVMSAPLGAMLIYYTRNASDIVLVQLGYKAVCMVIKEADLATNLVAGRIVGTDSVVPACFNVVFNKLTLLSWIPAFSGMGTVAIAAAFVYGNASGLPSYEDPEWRSVVEQRIKSLQRSVYALSAVLVSSTLTISLFAHLPTGLLEDANGHAKAVAAFAVGVTTFWGALFSLTLVATFAVPAFRIMRYAYGYQAVSEKTAVPVADLRVWLHEHVFVSFKNQLVNVLSLVAPLLVGPLSSLISKVAGT